MNVTILVSGEAGSGKSLIAQRIKAVLELDGIQVVTQEDADAPRAEEDLGRFLKAFAARGATVMMSEQSTSRDRLTNYDRAMNEAHAIGEKIVESSSSWRELARHPTSPLACKLYRRKYSSSLSEAYAALKVALHESGMNPSFPVIVKYDDRLYPETVQSGADLRDVDFRLQGL